MPRTDCTMLNGAEMAAGEDGEASFDVDQGRARLISPPPPLEIQQSQARAGTIRANNVLIPSTATPVERHRQDNARISTPFPWASC
jgi:hypothetical protein